MIPENSCKDQIILLKVEQYICPGTICCLDKICPGKECCGTLMDLQLSQLSKTRAKRVNRMNSGKRLSQQKMEINERGERWCLSVE